MKQTFSILMAMVAMMLISTACDKNSLVEQNSSGEVKMQTVTITAGIASDNDQTKTYIGDEVTESDKKFRKVYWSVGDEIAVVCFGQNGQLIVGDNGLPVPFKFILQSGAGTENGVFTGDIPDGSTIGMAVYPYSADGNVLTKTEQTATPNSFDPAAATMRARRDGEGKLLFVHSIAYLKITTDTDYSKISIDLVVEEDGTTATFSLNPATTGGTIAAGTYYLAAPAVTNDGFTMTFKKGDKSYTKSSSNTLTLENGKIKNLGEIKFDNALRANGHAYVDLGLTSGTLWATCNVGATTPEGDGNFYAWGETTSGKTTYEWGNYDMWADNSLKKYNTSDGKRTLELSDDAAHVNMGGDWRMPTFEDEEELRAQCTLTWETYNGVNGCKVVGPNNNFIFLPASGCRVNGEIRNKSSQGTYWLSSIYTDTSNPSNLQNSYVFFFRQNYPGLGDWGCDLRYSGQTVRGVMSKSN